MAFSTHFFVAGCLKDGQIDDPMTKGSHKGFILVSGPKGKKVLAQMRSDGVAAALVGVPWTARAMVVADTHVEKWERAIKLVASAYAPEEPLTGPVALTVRFVLRRPASVSEKKRPHPIVKPDRDKMLRAVQDALTGVMYVDDAQVIAGAVSKEYGDPPGVEITVEEIAGAQEELSL